MTTQNKKTEVPLDTPDYFPILVTRFYERIVEFDAC